MAEKEKEASELSSQPLNAGAGEMESGYIV